MADRKINWRDYTTIGTDNFLGNSFSVRFDNPVEGKNYLEIGSENVLYNNFIFEHMTGHIKIGNRCYIGGGSNIISINSVEIGDDVIMAWGVTVYDHNSHSIYWEERKDDIKNVLLMLNEGRHLTENKNWDVVKSKPIVIQDKVWIGYGANIMKGVVVGEGSVISANSVVVKDVPPYTVVGGNPAIVLKTIDKR